MGLGLGADATHGGDRFHGIFADGAFAGQHHGVRAVEHRVEHVAGLRSRRPIRMFHAVQHLCGGDDRTVGRVAQRDDALLDGRHTLHVHLHAQIAARHHHRVGGGNDRFEVLHRLRFLNLDDDPRATSSGLQLLTQSSDILRAAHERQADEIHVGRMPRRPVEILQILARQRFDGQIGAGQVQALPRAEAPRQRHFQPRPAGRRIDDDHGDAAVGEQDRFSGLEIVGQLPVRAGQFANAVLRRFRDERVFLSQPALHHVARKRSQAHLRTAQVLQDGDVTPHRPAHRADVGDDGAVSFVGAVREVESKDADARLDQPTQDFRRRRGRPDGRDDLRPAGRRSVGICGRHTLT